MKTAKKPSGTFGSLNLLLWFAFALFAIVLVVLFMGIQSLLIETGYRNQTLSTVKSACHEMSATLTSGESLTYSALREMNAVEEKYGVTMHFLYTDGRSVFSDGDESDRYLEIAEALKDRISAGEKDIVISGDSGVAYAMVVELGAEDYFLYASSSVTQLNLLEEGLVWASLATALFSLVFAFVASGFVAMLITKPVTEVTEQAKELARGHYDLDMRKDYFCSEIRELAEALDYARTEISRTDAMQKELIANVSHDFKTPLTMIKAYASMIREISGDDKEKRDVHAGIIIDEADRLAALVGDILDLSKLRAGVGAGQPTVFNLTELVYAIVSRFDYLRETQGYRIVTETEDDYYAYADRERIEQVIYNLIGNAVNYTGEDKKVTVRLLPSGEGTRFEVEDTGRGIPEEEQSTIWDRYYRSKETHKRPVQGTGLGLSIVKNILIAQNCPFGVRSAEGKGSVFWAEIPLPPEDVPKDTEKHRNRH